MDNKQKILSMLRTTFKHGRFYPSQNRPFILQGVHEHYEKFKTITDENEFKEHMRMAEMLLEHFRASHAKVIELRTGVKLTSLNSPVSVSKPGPEFTFF
ncbi:unnamed protein product [Blepharisma stoltei]|uniref:Uncharacterized protein n=1 Tax=Blepharisma stoltei TaxID=1481888 RepID=A0AAU9ID68_9CILI|nr:unnamed protein product [Blepharisma stoltei]